MTRRTGRTRNRRVVREPDRIQTRLLLWGLLAGLVVLVPLLANVWGHAEAVHLGYRLEQARATRARLLETNRLLRTEHAALRDLARIQLLTQSLHVNVGVRKTQTTFARTHTFAIAKAPTMTRVDLGLRLRRPEDTVVVSTAPGDNGGTDDDNERMIARGAAPVARGGSR